MKVNIGGFDYECRTAKRESNSITLYLGKYDDEGKEYTTTFVNMGIEKAYVIDGEWEYDEFAPKPIIAPHNIMECEYVTINGVLYMATQNIPNGEPVIVGQNAIVTTVEAQLLELKGE